jgi:hypothetical protein
VGGAVSDKELSFNRTTKQFTQLGVEELVRLQTKHQHVKLLLRDEMSIEGQLIHVDTFGLHISISYDSLLSL